MAKTTLCWMTAGYNQSIIDSCLVKATAFKGNDMAIAKKIARFVIKAANRGGVSITVQVRSGVGQGLRIQLLNATRDHLNGTCEPPVQQCLADCLKSGDVFLDIGANIGFFSIIAARLVGIRGRVVAVEPVLANVSCIQENARVNGLGNVTVLPVAAGACNGTGTLHLTAHSGGATLSSDDLPPDVTDKTEVPVLSIDGLIDSGRIAVPAMVKIDVEGTELAVLDGMRRTLDSHHPMIVFEVDDERPAAAEAKYAALAARLAQHGYRVERLERSYQGIAWSVIHGFAQWDGAACPPLP
ncbi:MULTISPECIES: FkbM family methyltransferase [unclassified Azospirillum]|uniref:FkbM family methyltransferase n=1 Tax=unclassified Azospirillum TaxID=2630922 RepID=UPI000D65ABB0|nr:MULTISPECIES: FkbM family methyltransferase [unclassified Azospirillum]